MNLGPYELDQIYTGDARELTKAIPDESVDLIFTDPPYQKEYLKLYNWLAETAARVLKPGGFCLAMCGGLYLNEIFRMMDAHMTFFWKYELILSGRSCVWKRKNGTPQPIINGAKPILAYSKGESVPRVPTLGIFVGTGEDKRYHIWGQDESSTRYYVDCFSSDGDIILDPFCGGGTTPSMSKMIMRHYLSFEIDPDTAERARQRVAMTQIPLLIPEPEQARFEDME